MDFQPAVIALEPIVIWRDRDKDQEQVFIDQAMRVPKLLVGMELGDKGPRDVPSDDLLSFSQVTGPRGGLAEFTGISHRPDDDIRLISTPGFTNLPADRSDRVRVPMLFEYRGEVVPSFPLQAIMLWLRATPGDVHIELGSQIILPNGWKIPIHPDGTITINPVAGGSVPAYLAQLLLAAQEHESHRAPTINVENLKDQIVLLRIADDPLQSPNIFSTAIATIQRNVYIRRVPRPALGDQSRRGRLQLLPPRNRENQSGFSRDCAERRLQLACFNGPLRNHLWLPTFLPLALIWFLVVG